MQKISPKASTTTENLTHDPIHNILQKLTKNDTTLQLTELRKSVLSIFLTSKKPMSAYEVLAILKKSRHNAEAMTVYRIIEYLIKKNLIHRISTENKFIFCSQIEQSFCEHQGLFFICKKCLYSYEIINKQIESLIRQLSEQHDFYADVSFVEIPGLCQNCYQKK